MHHDTVSRKLMRQQGILAVLIVVIMLSSCGCLGGGQSNDTNTAPLANSLLVVRSVEVMVGYNTSLSCVLNITNGQGLDNQVVYWYLDGQPLGQSSTYFGFATYNLSVSDVSGLALGGTPNSRRIQRQRRLCGLTSGRRVARYRGTNANTNPNAKTNRNTNPNAKTNRNTNPTTIVVAFPDAQTYTKSVTNTHSKFFADPVEANAIGYLRCEDVSSRRDRRPMRS